MLSQLLKRLNQSAIASHTTAAEKRRAHQQSGRDGDISESHAKADVAADITGKVLGRGLTHSLALTPELEGGGHETYEFFKLINCPPRPHALQSILAFQVLSAVFFCVDSILEVHGCSCQMASLEMFRRQCEIGRTEGDRCSGHIQYP